MSDFYRACVKLYASEPGGEGTRDAELFVPVFHDWIRDGALDMVAIDVADYAHVPDSPGIMLVAHEAAFALDRSDGRFGLFVQRRTPSDGGPVAAVATTLRHALQVAARLEREPRLSGILKFEAAALRIEANDRLLLPNSEEGYAAFEPIVREAIAQVFPGSSIGIERIENDPRDRLAVAVRTGAAVDLQEYLAA
ncbi:MAG TPA: hypothetical protein VMN39_11720 [Longimicrobiaceae bacterium]|nr:hypothetical protein [Longimicrobiaceae bacterium]